MNDSGKTINDNHVNFTITEPLIPQHIFKYEKELFDLFASGRDEFSKVVLDEMTLEFNKNSQELDIINKELNQTRNMIFKIKNKRNTIKVSDLSKYEDEVRALENEVENFETQKQNIHDKYILSATKLKCYIHQYFVKIYKMGYIHFKPSTGEMSMCEVMQLKQDFFTIKEAFDVLQKMSPSTMTFELEKPRHFHDKDLLFNTFRGFRFNKNDKMKYADFCEETKKGVDYILDHIKTNLCNKVEEQYSFFINCISCIMMGRALRILIYLQGPEGNGKSGFLDFIKTILGDWNVYRTSDSNIILGNFNGQLDGKLLLIMEELINDGNDFVAFANALKSIITEDTLEIKYKFKTPYQQKNHLSVIISTNQSALCLNKNTRRPFIPDLSNVNCGNEEYWTLFFKHSENKKVQHAFFVYMCELYNDKKLHEWHEGHNVPMSKAKQDKITEYLPASIVYVKDKLLTQKRDINVLNKTNYEEFKEWYNKNTSNRDKSKIPTIQRFNNDLREIHGINIQSGHAGYQYLTLEYEKVLAYYNKKAWIHETDTLYEMLNNTKPEDIRLDRGREKELFEKYLKSVFTDIELKDVNHNQYTTLQGCFESLIDSYNKNKSS